MRRLSAGRVRALLVHAPVLYWASAIALLLASAPQGANAASDLFLRPRGGAPAPSGAQTLCQTYSWACARGAGVSGEEAMRRVIAVNRQVNTSVHAIDDDQQYGVSEYWALPTATGGDCEDFALLKKRELVAQGVDPRSLLIATVLDRGRNPHAVLVFRSDRGDLVLDNLTDQVRNWRETRYVFLQMQDPDRPTGWVNVFTSG
ncbi:MAG: hypothetical protein CSA74_11510 [Rhodobacterales bacterium]|nr:MAG: hypothetical protein CSA74_11510 [Rhodobacterales bacterium]